MLCAAESAAEKWSHCTAALGHQCTIFTEADLGLPWLLQRAHKSQVAIKTATQIEERARVQLLGGSM